MGEAFLDQVYEARSPEEARALYDAWSDSYEAEVREHGYVTPGRCADALARFTSDLDAPLLDFGCGTGLSGLAFKLSGFATIDGVDISADMLDKARAKTIYRDLSVIPDDRPANIMPERYAAIAAVGVIGAGAAPISTFDVLMYALGKGGKLVLSLNDHALQDKANEARICEWVDCGAARLLFRENGPHLPGINLKSHVYVIEKL